MRTNLAIIATLTLVGGVEVSLKRNRSQLSFASQEVSPITTKKIERIASFQMPTGLVQGSHLHNLKEWSRKMKTEMLQISDLIPSTSEKDVFEALRYIAPPGAPTGEYLFCRYNLQLTDFAVLKFRPDLDTDWKQRIEADPHRICAILHIKRMSLVKSVFDGVDYTEWHRQDFIDRNSEVECPSLNKIKLCQSEVQVEVCSTESVCSAIHFTIATSIGDGATRAALVYDLSTKSWEPKNNVAQLGLQVVTRSDHIECVASGIPNPVAHMRILDPSKAESYCASAYQYLRAEPILSQLVFDIKP